MRKILYLLLFTWLFLPGCTKKTGMGQADIPLGKNGKGIPRRGEVLFLGHTSKHHDSGKYAPWLAISLFKAGINLTYTTELKDLNTANLNKYDGLIIYANHDNLGPDQEKALQDFVENGKGLIPLHSASGCFKNSDWYIQTIGGQFKSHGTATFTSAIVKKNHPVTEGLQDFSTWDETYVHQNLNKDKTVLLERVEGSTREPYTWVRNQGKGRVFYTAYGHNDSTWTNPGFLQLVNQGVMWAIGDQVRKQIAGLKIPNTDIYTAAGIKIADFTKRYEVPKMQEALPAAESQKLIQMPVDFEMKLFAAEPDIQNPIAMSWDEKGRLWIVESVDYPNTFVETDGLANDRIKICEDTNGDGTADKFTVFADKLNIPTSLVFSNGGVIVSMAPHFVFLKDTNGDDKADVRESIITGWGKNDTHAGPSNLQYGFDNKIWGVLGYSGFNGTVGGKNMSFGQGVYRFTPDGKELEYLASSSNNTWGLGFSEDNNVFISTANNTHSAFYSMPARYMQRMLPVLSAQVPEATAGSQPATPPVIQPIQKLDGHYDVHALTPNLRQVDVVGGFTAAAGHHLYTARNFPKEYWNRIAFISEPTVRLVHNAIIEPNGAGFSEKDGWNFLASSDEWFGPVHADVGPDGAVWVADWYNFIIQHNVFVPAQAPSRMVLPFTEQPRGQGNAFQSPLRDINYGRIYRVVYKKAKPYTPLKLSIKDLPGLLAALQSDNMFWRMTAQRLIVESKNQAALPGLFNIISNPKLDEIGQNGPAVHALWTLQGLGALDGKNAEARQVVTKALSHPAPGVRKAAIEVLGDKPEAATIIRKSNLLNDPNLNVRLSALVAIAALPASPEMGRLVYEAGLKPENAKDEWLQKAILAAAITHEKGYLAAASPKTAESGQAQDLTARVVKAVSQEVYNLPRRGGLPYPPDVSGKEIEIKGTISKGNRDLQGVILAQGNKENGYGMYIQDGKLNLVVKQAGKNYTATTSEPLPEKFDFVGQVAANGAMTVTLNGKPAAKANAGSLFRKPLELGLRTGQDVENENRMGPYEGTFVFAGNIQNATLELKRPDTPVNQSTAIKSKRPVTKTSKSGASKVLEPITINVKVVEHLMQFDKKQITIKAGQKVTINLDNPDGMQHNMVIIKPGTLQKVGEAADALARDPNGADKNYVPQVPEVLYATKLLNTGESYTLEFTAPTQPGDYVFVCTFPGHWRGMNGILRVEN